MKKLILALAAITITTQSCNKVKEEILKQIDPFTYSQKNISFEIPAQPGAEPVEYVVPQQSETVNIGQVIKENSGLGIDIDDFSAIYLKDVILQLKNGTDANNWTNLEYAEVEANTDKGIAAGKGWLKARADIANTEAERFSDKKLAFPSDNLKDYVSGSEETKIYYRYKIKPRTNGTTEAMKIDATVELEFKP